MDPNSAISPDFLKSIMGLKGNDPVGAIRPFMQIGNAQIIEPLLKDVDMYRFGPDLLQIACSEGKKDIVEMLLAKKVDVMQPPELVSGDDQYRKAPFTISAVKSGSLETLECILKHGGSLGDAGAICLSKKKKNVVASNLMGCAAYHGKREMLDQLIKRLGRTCLEVPALESVDVHGKKVTTTLQKEFAEYTPLMLAVASQDKSLECVKLLLSHQASSKVTDVYGNTLLHIAALNGNNKILEYLARNLSINLFQRNQKGETALNICQELKNQKGVDTLAQFQQDCDNTKTTADQLLAELEAKEEHDEEAKAKRRQKKWRNKINKIAKAENIDPEEVEKRLLAEEETRQEQARLALIEKEQQEKQAALKEQQHKEEIKRKRAELIRQQEQEELEERRRIEQLEREEREERRKAQEEKRERFRSAAREKRETEKPARQPRHQQEAEVEKPKTERVKSTRRQPAPQQEARQPRHQAQPKEDIRAKSKSVRRGGEEVEVENKIHGTEDKTKGPIFGLSGEMAVNAATSKKAQQRLRKQLKKQQEEEEEHKAQMELVAKEKAEAQAQKEIEERKRMAEERKADRLKKKQEKEEKEMAAKLQKEKEEAAAKEAKEAKEAEKLKKKKEKKEKKPEGKKEMVYRPKVKEDEGPASEEHPKENHPQPKKDKKPTPEPKKETEKPKKPEPKVTEPKVEEKAAEPATISKEETAVQSIVPKKSEKPKAPKKTKAEFGKENSNSAMNSSNKSSSDGFRLEIEQLQKLVLQKERDLGKLELLVDGQNRKMSALEQENQELKEQLLVGGDSLKQSVGQLNLQLKQQMKVNKLQASQILELEEQLWQSKQ